MVRMNNKHCKHQECLLCSDTHELRAAFLYPEKTRKRDLAHLLS